MQKPQREGGSAELKENFYLIFLSALLRASAVSVFHEKHNVTDANQIICILQFPVSL